MIYNMVRVMKWVSPGGYSVGAVCLLGLSSIALGWVVCITEIVPLLPGV